MAESSPVHRETRRRGARARTIGALVLCACGSGAASPEYEVPVARLVGKLVAGAASPSPRTRVTLLWQRPGGTYLRSDSGGPAAADFELDLREQPPREVYVNNVAYGDLVAYEDRNDNGHLDAVPFDAATAPDVVLGRTGEGPLSLAYDDAGFHWRAGNVSFSAQTRIELRLNASDAAQSVMCETFPTFTVNAGAPTVYEVYPFFDAATDLHCTATGWTARYCQPVSSACLPDGLCITLSSTQVGSDDSPCPP